MSSTPIKHTKRKKRPCRYCRRWFRPDPRVGDRQRACSRPGCQAQRLAEQQARWRRRNPDYFVARRILAKACEERPEDPVLPPPLDRLPWDVAQMQFSSQGAEFLASFGRVLLRGAQMQRALQHPDTS